MYWRVTILQVTTLALIMFVGFGARKRGLLTQTIRKGIAGFLVSISLPIQIFASFSLAYSQEMLVNGTLIFTLSLAIHYLAIGLTKGLYSKQALPIKAVFRYSSVFSNAAYIGFAILVPFYGDLGIFYASFYVMAFNVLSWTVGISFFTGKKEARKISELLKNPGLAAIGLGLLLFISPFTLPQILNQAFQSIGSLNAPLAMLIIGATLAEANLSSIFSGSIAYGISFLRLVLLPLLTLLILSFLPLPAHIVTVLVLVTAMPAPAMTNIFAERYGGDTFWASKLVFLSTLLSILTIPFIVYLLQSLGYLG